MPNVSERGLSMPASPIWQLVPYAEKAKQEGKKVYHLNIGQPDIDTPKNIINAIKEIDFTIWAYTASLGNLSYREKLADYYNNLGYAVSAADLLITYGGSEGVAIAMQACLNPGDEIIIPEPFYANYCGFVNMADVKIKPVLSTIENNFALPSIEAFEEIIAERTKAIMICNPNNPTGYLYSREELKQLRRLCLKYDLYLFSDEAYRDFCYDNEFVSPAQLAGLEQHVIILDTISKRYSACGARIGCLMTKNKGVLQASARIAETRISPPMVAQIAAEAALNTPSDYLESVVAEYRERRNLVVNYLTHIEGVSCPVPGGAFYVVAKLPVRNAADFCRWMLEEFDYENETVMMAPGNGFYRSLNKGIDEVRIAYVLNRVDLQKALSCIEKGLADYPDKVN